MKDIVIVRGDTDPHRNIRRIIKGYNGKPAFPFIIHAVIKRTGIEKSLIDHVTLVAALRVLSTTLRASAL